uniref:(northern house mosquito) hypothetical protein n=1 Tax=Culex pipiens TaxID=7175 RepID=A0A8D8FRI5_CULPI
MNPRKNPLPMRTPSQSVPFSSRHPVHRSESLRASQPRPPPSHHHPLPVDPGGTPARNRTCSTFSRVTSTFQRTPPRRWSLRTTPWTASTPRVFRTTSCSDCCGICAVRRTTSGPSTNCTKSTKVTSPSGCS